MFASIKPYLPLITLAAALAVAIFFMSKDVAALKKQQAALESRLDAKLAPPVATPPAAPAAASEPAAQAAHDSSSDEDEETAAQKPLLD